jgi:hypothetical protein
MYDEELGPPRGSIYEEEFAVSQLGGAAAGLPSGSMEDESAHDSHPNQASRSAQSPSQVRAEDDSPKVPAAAGRGVSRAARRSARAVH